MIDNYYRKNDKRCVTKLRQFLKASDETNAVVFTNVILVVFLKTSTFEKFVVCQYYRIKTI